MDGIDNGVQYEEGLEDGFFKSFQRYEPISVVEAFQALCLQEYDKVLKGKMGEEWQPSVGRMVKDMELNAMKKESDVWMLLSQLSEERMKRAKDNSHKSYQKSSKSRFNEADAPRVDDKMTILDAFEQDEILKEVDIIVKWLENQYGGLSPENASRRGSALQSPSHSTLANGFTSKKSTTAQTTAGNLHTSLIASDAPAIASRLDINGKLLQNSAQSRDSTSHAVKDGNSLTTPQTADQQLSQQIWRLFRGGQLDMVKNMLAKGGQSARFSTFAPLASGLSGAFSDPNLLQEAHHLYPSLQGEPTIPSNSLSNILTDTSSAWPYSTTLPSGIVHRSLMKNTMATISTQTLAGQGSSELGQGKSSLDPSSSASARASSVANLDPYERALYSCLSGFIGGVLPVCETWEDFVWVYLKTWLHQRIEAILSSKNASNSSNFSYNTVSKGELVWSTPAPSPSASLPSITSIMSASKFSEQLGEATSLSSAQGSSGVGLSSKKLNMDVDSDAESDDSETNLSQSSSSIALEGLATSINLPTTKSLGSVLESVFASSGRSSAFTSNSSRDKSANNNLTAYTSPTDSDMLMARLSEYLKSLEANKLPPFQVPTSTSGNTSNTTSSTNVLKRVSIEAKEAFRNIESFIILQSWHQLFRYLRQLCSQVIETANGGVNTMADAQHFNNPSHLLRFATHLVLVIRLIYPHIYDEDGTQRTKTATKNSSFGASKFSTLGQHSDESTLSEDASYIISRYVEHLMDKEGCRHLVAHYCANMPPNCTQLGYELYVAMMRRIKTTKERQQVIEEAGEAGLDSFLIASLLVEDTINDPSSIESLNLNSEPDFEPSHSGTGFSKSTFTPTPSRAGSQLKPLLPSSLGKPMSMKLTSRAAMDVAEETPSKGSRSFGAPVASLGSPTSGNAASRPKESWLSLLIQSEPTEYLQKLISLAASCHPSTVASTLTPTSISSTKSATTLIGEGAHRPSAADVERIHALEWLALSDSDEKQKLLCLKHANALARSFILSSSFAAARLLINTVNHLLSGLFTQHSLAKYEEEDDHDLSVEDFNNEEDEEDELSPEANSAFSSSPRALLKEFMSMSTFLEAIESFSRWYHEGYGKDKSTNWILRAHASSALQQRPTAADYDLFNDHHYDEDMEELNAAIPSDLKAKQKSSKLSNAAPVASTSKPFAATIYHATAAEAIEKLGQVVYYPNGWLNDGSNLLASQTAQRAVATLLKHQLINREDLNLPKSRAAQMSLLLHLCVPSSLLLLQHALMCTARLSDAVLLCNDLASDTSKLFMHCSSLSIQTFLMNVHLSSLFHLKATRSTENGSTTHHSDQHVSSNSNIPFPF